MGGEEREKIRLRDNLQINLYDEHEDNKRRKTTRESVGSVKDYGEKEYPKKTKATATLHQTFYWCVKGVPKVEQRYKEVQGLAIRT